MTGCRRRHRTEDDERGLTLAELLVHSALLAIVLPVIGVLLHGAVTSQRDVQSATHASSALGVAVRSVEVGVRSAAAVSLTAPTAGSQLLVVRTQGGAAGAASWVCQGWYYDAGTVYTRRVPAAGAATPAITVPTASGLTQWLPLASDVAPRVSGSPVFTLPPTAPGAVVVGLDLAVADGPRRLAVVSTAVASRPQGQTGSAPCF